MIYRLKNPRPASLCLLPLCLSLVSLFLSTKAHAKPTVYVLYHFKNEISDAQKLSTDLFELEGAIGKKFGLEQAIVSWHGPRSKHKSPGTTPLLSKCDYYNTIILDETNNTNLATSLQGYIEKFKTATYTETKCFREKDSNAINSTFDESAIWVLFLINNAVNQAPQKSTAKLIVCDGGKLTTDSGKACVFIDDLSKENELSTLASRISSIGNRACFSAFPGAKEVVPAWSPKYRTRWVNLGVGIAGLTAGTVLLGLGIHNAGYNPCVAAVSRLPGYDCMGSEGSPIVPTLLRTFGWLGIASAGVAAGTTFCFWCK
ncbi:MAG TPA: hypothetical protein PKE31_18255 [Pseudomonadota bacterium]|nr:hypothetical protein [Pseudomonadota bacterium]